MPELTVALSRLNVFVTPVIAVGLAERANAHAWGSARLGILTGLIGGKTDTARKDWQRGRGSPRA